MALHNAMLMRAVLLAAMASVAHAKCNDAALTAALTKLYQATNGPSWPSGSQANWLSSMDPCDGNARAHACDLPSTRIFEFTKSQCIFPPAVKLPGWANLGTPNNGKSLTSINMNGMTGTAGGTLPTELGQLTDLEVFEFQLNGITGK